MSLARTRNITRVSLRNSVSLKKATIQRKIEDLFLQLPQINGAGWNTSIYDECFVLASGYFSKDETEKRYKALLKRQNKSSTWGLESPLPHSAIVDTLAMLYCTHMLGKDWRKLKISRFHLSDLILKTYKSPHATVGFELVVPAFYKLLKKILPGFRLLMVADMYLLKVDQVASWKITQVNAEGKLFSAKTTLNFSAEYQFLMSDIKPTNEQMLEMINPINGGIGSSPAATAAAIIEFKNRNLKVPKQLYKYLDAAFKAYKKKGFPNLYPIKESQELWNALVVLVAPSGRELLKKSSIIQDAFLKISETVTIHEDGVPMDRSYPVPDLDDTAVTFWLKQELELLGKKPTKMNPKIFEHFYNKEKDRYFCYPFESHPSPAALLHTIRAIESGLETGNFSRTKIHGLSAEEFKQKLLKQLHKQTHEGKDMAYDKWHAIMTYGAQRVLSIDSVRKKFPRLTEHMVFKILALQDKKTGGFGEQGVSKEETAYAVMGLLGYLKNPDFKVTSLFFDFVASKILKAWDYIFNATEPIDFICWISKNVYLPHSQRNLAVLMSQYEMCQFLLDVIEKL